MKKRGICNAALKELLSIVKDQIEQRSVVCHLIEQRVRNLGKMQARRHCHVMAQLIHIDVEGMRVVTNNRCVADEIKSERVENVVTGGSSPWNFWKSWKTEQVNH